MSTNYRIVLSSISAYCLLILVAAEQSKTDSHSEKILDLSGLFNGNNGNRYPYYYNNNRPPYYPSYPIGGYPNVGGVGGYPIGGGAGYPIGGGAGYPIGGGGYPGAGFPGVGYPNGGGFPNYGTNVIGGFAGGVGGGGFGGAGGVYNGFYRSDMMKRKPAAEFDGAESAEQVTGFRGYD